MLTRSDDAHGIPCVGALKHHADGEVGHKRRVGLPCAHITAIVEKTRLLASLAFGACPFGLQHFAPLARIAVGIGIFALDDEDREQRMALSLLAYADAVLPERLGGVALHFVQAEFGVQARGVEVRLLLSQLLIPCSERISEYGLSVFSREWDALARSGFLVQTLHATAQSLQPLYAEAWGGLYGYFLLCIDQRGSAIEVFFGQPRCRNLADLADCGDDTATASGIVLYAEESGHEAHGSVAGVVGSRFGHFPQGRCVDTSTAVAVAHTQDAVLPLVPRGEVECPVRFGLLFATHHLEVGEDCVEGSLVYMV